MGCVVIILSLVVVCVCVQRCKDTAENDDSEQSSGIDMMEVNPLAVVKLATQRRLESEAAAEAREARNSTLLHSDSETDSERQARRAARRAKRKERLDKSNKAIFGTSSRAM